METFSPHSVQAEATGSNIWIEVNLSRLRSNLEVLKTFTAEDAPGKPSQGTSLRSATRQGPEPRASTAAEAPGQARGPADCGTVAGGIGVSAEMHGGSLSGSRKTGDRPNGGKRSHSSRPGGVSCMAVVKANAYGHGLLPVAKCLSERVEWFGVASLAEGLSLRKGDLSLPILVLGHLAPGEIREALLWDLTLSVSDAAYGGWIQEEALKIGHKAKIHVKVDTGMGRFGLRYEEAESQILRLAGMSHLNLEGLYTHFPQAERPQDSYTNRQIEDFTSLEKRLRRGGIEFTWVHAAGSSGLVNYRSSHFNMVRPGLMLYGIYPDSALRSVIALKPVLALRGRWILIKKVNRGESVGYGRTFMSQRDTVLGVLGIGYSHGYSWRLGGRGRVLFRGEYYPVVGRVSMDSVTVDLGPDRDPSVGDCVTLIGNDYQSAILVEDLAQEGGTIPYEVVTRLSTTVERIYLTPDETVSTEKERERCVMQ